MDYNFKLILIFLCCLIASFRPAYAISEHTIQYDSFNLTVSECSEQDILTDEQCSLHCRVVQTNESYTFALKDSRWTYWTTNSSINMTFFDRGEYNESVGIMVQVYDMWLNVTKDDYHMGNYRCYFALEGDKYVMTEIYNDFNFTSISPNSTTGSLMGDNCTVDSDCLAMFSVCDSVSSVCVCKFPFDVPRTDAPDNPACLQRVAFPFHCDIQEQCDEKRLMKCVNERCLCDGYFANVTDYTPLIPPFVPACIEISKLFGYCDFDANCRPISNYSICVNNTCECDENSSMTTNLRTCKATPLTIETSTCQPEDFDDDQCNLACTVTNHNLNLKFHHYFWTYKISSGFAPNVTLFNSSMSHSADWTEITGTLPLTIYSAGLYFCQFYFIDAAGNLTEMNRAFNLSDVTGILIGSECENAVDCFALNSQCIDRNVTNAKNETELKPLCECAGEYDIQYWLYPNAPACLNHVPENGSCNTDDQCTQLHQSLYCSNQTCTCTGQRAAVKEENNQWMCLIPAPLTAKCDYVEQCWMITANTDCVGNVCVCADGYEMNDSKTSCDYKLSGGAIAGIVIGSVAGAAVILSIIIYILKS